MKKFISYIGLLLFALLTPSVVLAQMSGDQPLYIKSATVETEQSRVIGQVRVCNLEGQELRFTLNTKNAALLYKRHLTIDGSSCKTYQVRFSPNFAEMSTVGDIVEFSLQNIRTNGGNKKSVKTYFKPSDVYSAVVLKGEKDYDGCTDEVANDGIFAPCATDFIYHSPSGLRIKVMAVDSDKITFKVANIEWGGVEDFVLYKGRSKELRADGKNVKLVRLTNVTGEKFADSGLLDIETEK